MAKKKAKKAPVKKPSRKKSTKRAPIKRTTIVSPEQPIESLPQVQETAVEPEHHEQVVEHVHHGSTVKVRVRKFIFVKKDIEVLLLDNGKCVQKQTTDKKGWATFTQVPHGNYILTIDLPLHAQKPIKVEGDTMVTMFI